MNELGNTPADKNYKPSGISRAESRAWEAYPYKNGMKGDICAYSRPIFVQGYEQAEKDLADEAQWSSGPDGFYYGKGYKQAEKDLALTWEDIKTIEQIIATSDWYDFEINGKLWSKEFYEEVLKRFEEAKK